MKTGRRPKLHMWANALRDLTEISRITGIPRRRLQKRLDRGETIDEAAMARVPRPCKVKPESRRKKARKYLYDGMMLTCKEMAVVSGLDERTLRTRLRIGWSVADSMETPCDARRGPPKNDEARRWKWRTERWRLDALRRARVGAQVKLRTIEDAPLAFDPWSQAAIDAAVADGGWPMDLVGIVMGGVTRERIRQVEISAFRRIRENAAAGDEDAIGFLAHWEGRK